MEDNLHDVARGVTLRELSEGREARVRRRRTVAGSSGGGAPGAVNGGGGFRVLEFGFGGCG